MKAVLVREVWWKEGNSFESLTGLKVIELPEWYDSGMGVAIENWCDPTPASELEPYINRHGVLVLNAGRYRYPEDNADCKTVDEFRAFWLETFGFKRFTSYTPQYNLTIEALEEFEPLT